MVAGARGAAGLCLAAALFEGTVRAALAGGLLHLPVLGDAVRPAVLLGQIAEGATPEKMWSATRGWANAPGTRTRPWTIGGPLRTETVNAIGARRIGEVSATAPSGTRRVVAVGDSFTFGAEVNDEDVWLSAAERALPATEIVNLGVNGYGQDQALLTLREVGLGLHPDVVVVGFVGDDLERNLFDFHFARKPRFVLRAGALALTGAPVPSPDELRRLDHSRVRSLDLLAVATGKWAVRGWAEATPLAVALISAMASESRTSGAQLLLVHLPGTLPYVRDLDADFHAPAFDEACALDGVRCLDLRPVLRDARDRGVDLLEVTHWSPEAHAIAAAELVKALQAMEPPAAPVSASGP